MWENEAGSLEGEMNLYPEQSCGEAGAIHLRNTWESIETPHTHIHRHSLYSMFV